MTKLGAVLAALVLAGGLHGCGGDSPESERENPAAVADGNVRIGAFNMQNFGATKASSPSVMTGLATVITEYDALVLQEIEDVSGQAPQQLLARVNQLSDKPYMLALSERLGRTSAKEQYGLIYRPDRVTLVATLQIDDPEDEFEREPYVFQVQHGEFNYGLIALHAKPDDAVSEISMAAFAYDAFRNASGVESAFVIGDLNADCEYATDEQLRQTQLCSDPRFSWLISDAADTTTGTTACAYDRIVVRGPISNRISAPAIYRFDQHLGITGSSLSDHYPVEVEVGSGGSDYSGFSCAPGDSSRPEASLLTRIEGGADPLTGGNSGGGTGGGGSGGGSTCCRVCSSGQACGDSCISRNSTCSVPRGCACNG